MKILIIGGKGTIGKVVAKHYSTDHEVIVAGRRDVDLVVDITDSESITTMFENIGKLDAILCIAGEAKWDYFENLSEEDFYIGIKSKLMGQVNLVKIGKEYIKEGGSITLSTGILADDPVLMTSSAAMVNGAIHSFTQAVALELKDVRVNVVSLGVVENAYEKYKKYFPDHEPISMEKVIRAYVRSVEGTRSGEIIRVYQ